MVEVDEDEVPRPGASAEDTDLSDETQDFRFLASISREDAKVPKRGEKDFEPHATALQSNTLDASRQAMHNALAFQRVHQPKNYTVATYHPETNMAYTHNPKGPLFARMGHVRSAKEDPLGDNTTRGQRLWLLPEEALYLIERGTIDVKWPVTNDEDASDQGLSMSLQAAYAMFIGDEDVHQGALSFERYSVYSGLKRAGYTIQRAPSWSGPGPPLPKECYPPEKGQSWRTGLFAFTSLWCRIFASRFSKYTGEREAEALVPPALYRGYAEIYRRLALVGYHDATTEQRPAPAEFLETDPSFRITYHVWRPGSQTFKKSAPGSPDFRIAVINAREIAVPTLMQLSALMEMAPYDPPEEGTQLYQKLKHGYKNVILAVVDQGVVSYLRVSDSVFGREKLYERKGRGPGGKRGGRKGGRGRGR